MPGKKNKKHQSSYERSNKSADNLQKFAEMMSNIIIKAKSKNWKQGWLGVKGTILGLPQNITGRTYSGGNSFFLMADTSEKGYNTPVYMTFKQAKDRNLHVNAGEKSVPIFKWGLSIKDENGKTVSEEDYNAMTKEERDKFSVRPYPKVYHVFNIDQTNLSEVNKKKYDAIVARFKAPDEEVKDSKGMYINDALDRMFKEKAWHCDIRYDKPSSRAFYVPSQDFIVLPMKEQFNIGKTAEEVYRDGMEYYSTALHEMAHSTGHESRLNRQFGAKRTEGYAHEELIAEMTAALVGSTMGFDKKILENNANYLKGWLENLKRNPESITTIMSDVGKASDMIIEKIDEQRVALGQTPLKEGNLEGLTEDLGEETQQSSKISNIEAPQEEISGETVTSSDRQDDDISNAKTTSSKSESTELIYSNGKQRWDSFDSFLKAAKENQITRSEFMAMSAFNIVKDSHPHNLTQAAIEYLQQQRKGFTPEEPIVPGSPLYDAIKLLKEGKVFAEYRGNREVDLSSSIKDDEMLSAEDIEKLKAMALDASDGKSKSSNIDNKPLIEKVPYGEFYLPEWSIPYLKDGNEYGLTAEQLKTVKDFEKDFPSKLSIEITESSIEGNHNTELGPATTVDKANIYYFEQHISDLFPTDESTRDRLDKDLSEDNKSRKTLSDLQAQYSNINAQYPAAVNDERTHQIAKRIRQAEQIITAYNANVEAVYGESFMFSPEAQTMLIPQTIYSGRERSALDKTNATPIDESLSTKSETFVSPEGMPKVDLQSQWENIKKQLNTVAKEERQSANYDLTKDTSLARDYIANNFQVSRETFDKFSDSDKERLVSLYSNYSSSLLTTFTEQQKVEKEISNFILLGGLLDPENAQKVLEKGYEKMTLLRETPNVNLAVLKSSVLSLADNQHRQSTPIAYGQYDIPIWAVKHLSEGKDSSLSEAKLSEIESFKSQLPNNSFFEFKDSNVSYSEKPAFGPATNVIKAHIYVSRDQHQEESVSINNNVNDSEEYTMARKLPQQDSKKNEEIFYSSVVSIKSGEDLQLFDSMREKGHLNKMLKVAAEYDYGEDISLDATHKSPLQNSGDEVLRENKNYAVVYNNSAGGAYEIFRKSPQSEILNSINRYGLPDTASEDVKRLSGRKDYSSDHDLYEATQHEDHDALNFAAASRGMTPKQMEESLSEGTEEKLPDFSEQDKKRGLEDRDNEVEKKNEELSGGVSSKGNLQDNNAEDRRKEESRREAERKEKEKQDSQKKDDSSTKIITAAFLRASLLSTAFLSAKDNNRVWLNADAKTAPSFYKTNWEISPYNQLFMSLNSDKNGYATNVYTTFKHEDSIAIKKGSQSLPYSWTDWSMYKSKGSDPKLITANQYENLPPSEKELYRKEPVKFDRKVFNIDQSLLKDTDRKSYNALLGDNITHLNDKQTLASSDGVSFIHDDYAKFRNSHPNHIVITQLMGNYAVIGRDSKYIQKLNIDNVELSHIIKDKDRMPYADIKSKDLDAAIKAIVSSGKKVAIWNPSQSLNLPNAIQEIVSNAETTLDSFSKNTGIKVQKSLTQPTSYDKETDTIILNNKKSVNPGNELRAAVENSNAIYFAISQSVANNKRLDISNQFSMPEKDIESVKQLIATVSAGVLSLKQAHPAVLSDQVSHESVESWAQDIKNDPHLLSSLERNVNNTVNTIEKLVKGEQVDYAAINGKSLHDKTKSFNYVSELNEIAKTDPMSAVIIRDKNNASTSVILSTGIETVSENGVLNNNKFRQALLQQGDKDIKFYQSGGTLGLNKDDSFFKDKIMQIVSFNGKDVLPQQDLHINDHSRNVSHSFEDVSAVKDDNNRWHLYIKEKGQPYFIIQPDKSDLSRLFEAFKSHDQQSIYDAKTSLGEKYIHLAQSHPELKVDFLMPKVPSQDIARIQRAGITRDAQDRNKYLIFATIDGKNYLQEISREDFRRMWKVDNMQSYKNALAAKIFSNVLHEGQSISDTPLKEEKEQTKLSTVEKIDTKQSFENDEDVNSSKGMSRK